MSLQSARPRRADGRARLRRRQRRRRLPAATPRERARSPAGERSARRRGRRRPPSTSRPRAARAAAQRGAGPALPSRGRRRCLHARSSEPRARTRPRRRRSRRPTSRAAARARAEAGAAASGSRTATPRRPRGRPRRRAHQLSVTVTLETTTGFDGGPSRRARRAPRSARSVSMPVRHLADDRVVRGEHRGAASSVTTKNWLPDVPGASACGLRHRDDALRVLRVGWRLVDRRVTRARPRPSVSGRLPGSRSPERRDGRSCRRSSRPWRARRATRQCSARASDRASTVNEPHVVSNVSAYVLDESSGSRRRLARLGVARLRAPRRRRTR